MIIDSSVIAKWFAHEPDSALALKLREQIIDGASAAAPDLIFYELGNLLSRKSSLDAEQVSTLLAGLVGIGLEIISPSEELMKAAADVVKQCDVSFYDACFVAAAKLRDVLFVTADLRLLGKTKTISQVISLESLPIG